MSTKSPSLVMLRRDVKHLTRNPATIFNAVLMPVVILFMFVYLLGDAFNVGVDYVDYATPGMILLAVSYGVGGTAIAANADMTKGIINRFKVMDVPRGAVLIGKVVASVLINLIAVVVLIGVAFALGFRPSASAADWVAVLGLVVLLGVATGWITVALGLAAKSPETAGMAVVPLIMLPFFSSAIVPADKMGPGVRQFAEYQPFTPIIESLRGFLNGAPQTSDVVQALAWCVAIAIVGYLWSSATFRKRA
ncbi:ABC transporter permease [Kribbella sp. NPDC020789]